MMQSVLKSWRFYSFYWLLHLPARYAKTNMLRYDIRHWKLIFFKLVFCFLFSVEENNKVLFITVKKGKNKKKTSMFWAGRLAFVKGDMGTCATPTNLSMLAHTHRKGKYAAVWGKWRPVEFSWTKFERPISWVHSFRFDSPLSLSLSFFKPQKENSKITWFEFGSWALCASLAGQWKNKAQLLKHPKTQFACFSLYSIPLPSPPPHQGISFPFS